MSNITFSEIMNFYPGHNKSVYDDLKKYYQQGSLIPFVGAGLSVFCGYLSWSRVLERLAGFVYDKDVKDKIYQRIKNDELLHAAQEIYDHYPRMLKELQKIIDYDKIKNCDVGTLHASAAYVLPYLFGQNIVMTTNFDRVLEEVYDKCHAKFAKIVSPHEADILAQIRQSNPHCLFKLHGDIGPETYDIEKLVFTQAQYDKAYDFSGPLMEELPQWFQNKRLLFLGCSLTKDKTMEVLQQVTAKNPGLDHYAILACKPEEIGQRSIELGELGISPIFYPMDRHEAVRVILERLLEETDQSAYEELNRHTEKNIPASKAERRFMYDSGYIEFTGRKKELEQLENFCQDSEVILWWAVTGPGGIGKSRLVYEFTETRKKEGWEVVWLNRGLYDNLLQVKLPVERCILVADDVQPHIQIIGKWIASLSNRRRSEKLRIVLLEREGEDFNSAKWAEMMQLDSPYDDTIQAMCYHSEFLQLELLSEEELKTIMMDFSAVSGRVLKDNGQAERLLKTLQKVDGELQRPIYALAIADAWCNGDDPTRWDKEKILDALTTRELKFYYGRLRNLSPDRITKELCSEFESLLARSCLQQILPLNAIEAQECPKFRSRADKLEMDFEELLRAIGIVHEVEVYVVEREVEEAEEQEMQQMIIKAVVLDCPDLVKEHLVLQQAFDKGHMELMLPNGWENNRNQLRFFRRLLLDYPEKLEGKNQFWKAFFAGAPKSEFCARMYSDLLLGITVQLPKLGERAIKRLDELNNQFTANENIGTLYAGGLFSMTVEHSKEECEQCVLKLETLHEQYESNEKVAVSYVGGLVNLIAKQPQEERVQSVFKVTALYEQYKNNEEMAVLYAKGLLYLTVKQSQEECAQSVLKLEALYEQYEGNEKVAVSYARGLLNLMVEQTLEERRQSLSKLRALAEQHVNNAEVMIECVKAVYILVVGHPFEECAQSILKPEALYEQYRSKEEALGIYINGLIKLMVEQILEKCKQMMDEMQDWFTFFQGNEKIVVEYASCLVAYSFVQNTEMDVHDTLQKSKQLLKQYPQNSEIRLSYAKTWFNLTLVQSEESLHQTVLELREFLLLHPDINNGFQEALDEYLDKHPDHAERYSPLRIAT